MFWLIVLLIVLALITGSTGFAWAALAVAALPIIAVVLVAVAVIAVALAAALSGR